MVYNDGKSGHQLLMSPRATGNSIENSVDRVKSYKKIKKMLC